MSDNTGHYKFIGDRFVKVNDKPLHRSYCFSPPRWKQGNKPFYDVGTGKYFFDKQEKRDYMERKGIIEW